MAERVLEEFPPGDGAYAGTLWGSLDSLTEGNNVLAVRLIENGVLAVGTRAMLVAVRLPASLFAGQFSEFSIHDMHREQRGAILSLDFHPQKRNLLLCGNMESRSFILDTESVPNTLVKIFLEHSNRVVRALWSPSGKYFVTASYDRSVIRYSTTNGVTAYEMTGQRTFKGAVECMAMAKDKDVCVVGVRDDHLLHCLDLSNDRLTEIHQIDLVKSTPIYISFSHDGRHILVSTNNERLFIYSWENRRQIANFHGLWPRHCWDPSGRYIYATSQNDSICVWEIRTGNIVTNLEGHGGVVHDLYFCSELGIMVSGNADGSVKFWERLRPN